MDQNGGPLVPPHWPSGSDRPMVSRELGVCGGRGWGQMLAGEEDGPFHRPALGTIPAHEFCVLAL